MRWSPPCSTARTRFSPAWPRTASATAALTILLYLAALRLLGRWNQPFSGAGFGYSVLIGVCVGAGTVSSGRQ